METEEDIPAEESGEPDEWVTLAQYHNAAEAHMVRLRLEGEGIACELLDEQMTTINPIYSLATGGVRLQVPKSQVEEAARLVRGMFDSEPKERITCPECGKQDVMRTDLQFPRVFWTIIQLSVLTFIGIVMPFIYKLPMRCRDCGHAWKLSPKSPARLKENP